MREILFRGKREDNGEWIKGYLLGDEITGQYFIHASGNSVNESPKVGEEGVLHFLAFEVIPETVGQYTGLKDKHGTQIFEGDIVDYEDESPGQYEYHDSTFINRGVIEYDDGVFYWTNLVAAQFDDSVYKGAADCVVIGNIHDNPELLEEET